jgi:hypothetical protein
MSVNSLNTFLNIRDAHLRVVSGNVHATAMNIGGINVDVAHGLQSVTNQGNVTSNTLQFSNSTTAFVTTANVTVGRDLTVTGNALVSSNLTVTGNVTVSDTLTVTENLFVSNNLTVTKDVTVTGNTFYTNPMSISVDSNVVAEYTGPHDRPLRKYPEVALTANDNSSTSGYVADQTAFSGNADGNAYRLFDHSLSTAYQSGGSQYSSGDSTGSAQTTTATDGTTHQGVAITLDLATKIRLSYAKITSHTYYGRTPVEGTFLGSNNNSTWDVIGTFSGLSTTAAGQTHMVHISDYATKSAYRYIRLVVTKIHTSAVQNGGSLLEFRELEYYGHEEGDSSLDTTLKSVYNVPGTQQLEVYYDAKDLADGAVTSVTDLSPNTNNGTVSGDPQVSNGAFVFDGVGDSIGGSITNGTGETNFTISMWVKSNVLNDAPFLFGEDVTNKGIGMTLNPGITFMYVVGGVAYQYNTSDLIRIGEWSHLLLYRNSGEMSVYVNGIYIYPIVTGSGALDLNANTQFTLGSRDTTEYFTGSIANFRLFSKALNAGQVQELYDYQKDYFLGSRSSVTLYKGHLGIGVAEPSGQLELAGDERIQEYPPGPMDGYSTYIEGHGVFGLHHSPGSGGNGAVLNAFNKKAPVGDFWYSTTNVWGTNGSPPYMYTGTDKFNGISGEWVYMTLPYYVDMKYLQITARNGEPTSGPNSAIIFGSSDGGVTWEQVGSWSDKTSSNFWLDGGVPSPSFVINSTKSLNAIGFVVTETTGYYAFTLGEIKFFGTPGPTTLDKGSLSLTRSLDVPRISRYDVDTETPRPEKLVVDFDTTVNSSATDISGQGNHGTFVNGASYSAADKAFSFGNGTTAGQVATGPITVPAGAGVFIHSVSFWAWVSDWDVPFFYIDDTYPVVGATSTTPHCVLDATGRLRYDFWSNAVYVASTNIFPKYQWVHVGLVYKGGAVTSTSAEVYYNGVKQALDAYTGAVYTSPSSVYLQLGSSTSTINIKMSNFKLYSVALEASEVRKLYNLGRTGRSMVISDTAVGIGKVPEAQLDVRGTIKGINMTSSPAAFSAAHTSGISSVSTATTIIWNDIQYNVGGCYDNSTGNFTAPISGYYYFSFHMITQNDNETTYVAYFINDADPGTNAKYGVYEGSQNDGSTSTSGAAHRHLSGSWLLYLSEGTKFKIVLRDGTSNGNLNRFTGFFVSS